MKQVQTQGISVVIDTFSKVCRNHHDTKCSCIRRVLQIQILSIRTVDDENTDKSESCEHII